MQCVNEKQKCVVVADSSTNNAGKSGADSGLIMTMRGGKDILESQTAVNNSRPNHQSGNPSNNCRNRSNNFRRKSRSETGNERTDRNWSTHNRSNNNNSWSSNTRHRWQEKDKRWQERHNRWNNIIDEWHGNSDQRRNKYNNFSNKNNHCRISRADEQRSNSKNSNFDKQRRKSLNKLPSNSKSGRDQIKENSTEKRKGIKTKIIGSNIVGSVLDIEDEKTAASEADSELEIVSEWIRESDTASELEPHLEKQEQSEETSKIKSPALEKISSCSVTEVTEKTSNNIVSSSAEASIPVHIELDITKTCPKIKVKPLKKLLKEELLVLTKENLEIIDSTTNLQTEVSKTQLTTQQPNGVPQRQRYFSTGSNSSQNIDINIGEQLANLDKAGLKYIINNSNTKYDEPLQAHARKRLHEELRRQLKSIQLDKPKLTLEKELVEDEIVDAIELPEKLLEEIRKAFGIDLNTQCDVTASRDVTMSNDRHCDRRTPKKNDDSQNKEEESRHKSDLKKRLKIDEEIKTTTGTRSKIVKEASPATSGKKTVKEPSSSKESKINTKKLVEKKIQERLNKDTGRANTKPKKEHKPVAFCNAGRYSPISWQPLDIVKNLQQTLSKDATSFALCLERSPIGENNEKSDESPEKLSNSLEQNSKKSPSLDAGTNSNISDNSDSESGSQADSDSSSASELRRLKLKLKYDAENVVSSFEKLIFPSLSDNLQTRYHNKYCDNIQNKLHFISCVCSSEYNSQRFSKIEMAKIQKNLKTENNRIGIEFLLREIVNVFNYQKQVARRKINETAIGAGVLKPAEGAAKAGAAIAGAAARRLEEGVEESHTNISPPELNEICHNNAEPTNAQQQQLQHPAEEVATIIMQKNKSADVAIKKSFLNDETLQKLRKIYNDKKQQANERLHNKQQHQSVTIKTNNNTTNTSNIITNTGSTKSSSNDSSSTGPISGITNTGTDSSNNSTITHKPAVSFATNTTHASEMLLPTNTHEPTTSLAATTISEPAIHNADVATTSANASSTNSISMMQEHKDVNDVFSVKNEQPECVEILDDDDEDDDVIEVPLTKTSTTTPTASKSATPNSQQSLEFTGHYHNYIKPRIFMPYTDPLTSYTTSMDSNNLLPNLAHIYRTLPTLQNMSSPISSYNQQIDLEALRQQNLYSEAVVNNLRELNLRIIEVQRRKTLIEDMLMQLQKDKMDADVLIMKLQNEKLSLMNMAMAKNVTATTATTTAMTMVPVILPNGVSANKFDEPSQHELPFKSEPMENNNSSSVMQQGILETKSSLTNFNTEKKTSNKELKIQARSPILSQLNTLKRRKVTLVKRIKFVPRPNYRKRKKYISRVLTNKAKKPCLSETTTTKKNVANLASAATFTFNETPSSTTTPDMDAIAKLEESILDNLNARVIPEQTKINSITQNQIEIKPTTYEQPYPETEASCPNQESTTTTTTAKLNITTKLTDPTHKSPVINPTTNDESIGAVKVSVEQRVETPSELCEDDNMYKHIPNGKVKNIQSPVTQIRIYDNIIMASAEDGDLYVINIKTLKLFKRITKHSEAITHMYVCKKSSTLYTTSLDGFMKISALANLERVLQTIYFKEPLQSLDIDWGVVFIGSRWGHVYSYNIAANQVVHSPLCTTDHSIIAVKTAKEGPRKVIILASKGNHVQMHDAESGLLLRTFDMPAHLNVYSLLLDYGYIYCGTQKKEIHKYDFTTGEHVAKLNCGNGAISMLLYKNQYLLVGCYDGYIYVLDKETCLQLGRFPGSGRLVLALATAGDKVISAAKDISLEVAAIPEDIIKYKPYKHL